MKTTAVRDGDGYVLNGSKMFITNASHAAFYSVFAVTDAAAGHRGISAFVVDRDTPGLSVSKHLDKMGQRATDTAAISFDGVRVPAATGSAARATAGRSRCRPSTGRGRAPPRLPSGWPGRRSSTPSPTPGPG